MAADVLWQDEDVGLHDDELFFEDHILQSIAYGEETPDADEDHESWILWKDSLGGVPPISGDANWGDLVVEEACYGPVRKLTSGNKTLTVLQNKYGTGSGTVVSYIRGSDTPFAWDSVLPAWQAYTTPVYCTWEYVQLKVDVS